MLLPATIKGGGENICNYTAYGENFARLRYYNVLNDKFVLRGLNMARPKRNLIRITTNIDSSVLQCVDQFAEDNGLTRTTAITILLSQKLASVGYAIEKDEKIKMDKNQCNF